MGRTGHQPPASGELRVGERAKAESLGGVRGAMAARFAAPVIVTGAARQRAASYPGMELPAPTRGAWPALRWTVSRMASIVSHPASGGEVNAEARQSVAASAPGVRAVRRTAPVMQMAPQPPLRDRGADEDELVSRLLRQQRLDSYR